MADKYALFKPEIIVKPFSFLLLSNQAVLTSKFCGIHVLSNDTKTSLSTSRFLGGDNKKKSGLKTAPFFIRNLWMIPSGNL